MKAMKKLNEYTRKHIEVTEINTIFRTCDSVAYSVYKDSNNKYYIDAYDGAYSIAELSGEFPSDAEAVAKAQELINEVNN